MPNKNSRISTVEEIAGFLTHRDEELDERERKILELHYGIGQSKTASFAQIGQQLHLSGGRVREIEALAVWRLRNKQPRGRLNLRSAEPPRRRD